MTQSGRAGRSSVEVEVREDWLPYLFDMDSLRATATTTATWVAEDRARSAEAEACARTGAEQLRAVIGGDEAEPG